MLATKLMEQVVGGRSGMGSAAAVLSWLQTPAAVRGSSGQGWGLGLSYPDRGHLCFHVSFLSAPLAFFRNKMLQHSFPSDEVTLLPNSW